MSSAVAIQDIREIQRRREQFYLDMQPFVHALNRIYTLMPAKMVFDIKTGVLTHIVEPEWQQRIDKIEELKNEFIKANYPELTDQL